MDPVIVIVISVLAGFALAIAQISFGWKKRCFQTLDILDAAKATVDQYREYTQLLEKENKKQFEVLNEAFDYLNENQPFSSHNDGLMQVRNVLMRAIQESTSGRRGH